MSWLESFNLRELGQSEYYLVSERAGREGKYLLAFAIKDTGERVDFMPKPEAEIKNP